jgi:adenylylsulfate reductase subunit B
MHIDKLIRRAVNIEPNFCWECFACVKACPQNAIDVRGYADFAPMGHKVRVLREEEKGVISWKIKFRNGHIKNFVSPITTKPWGKYIHKLAEKDVPNKEAHANNLLFGEPTYLKTGKVPVSSTGVPQMEKIGKLKQGVYY